MNSLCPICGGSRIIRLPMRRAVTRASASATLVAVSEASYRDYPCPECSELVAQDHVCVIGATIKVDSRYAARTEIMDIARHDAVHAIAEAILKNNLIRFDIVPDDREMVVELRAGIGVASTRFVASIEQRIVRGCYGYARHVINAAIENVRNWNSHFGGRDGTIHKDQAAREMEAALEVAEKSPPQITVDVEG